MRASPASARASALSPDTRARRLTRNRIVYGRCDVRDAHTALYRYDSQPAHVALLTLAVTAAWMLAVLQADVTNVTDYPPPSWVTDGTSAITGPTVFRPSSGSAPLVRGLLATAVLPHSQRRDREPTIVQAGFVLAALVVIYRSTTALATPAGATVRVGGGGAAVPWGFLSVGFLHQLPMRPSDHLFLRCRTGGHSRDDSTCSWPPWRSARSTRRRPCFCRPTCWPSGRPRRAARPADPRISPAR